MYVYLRRYNVRVQSTLEYGSTKVRRYLRTTYKRNYFRTSGSRKYNVVLSYNVQFVHVQRGTGVLSYESTKVLSYESTKVLPYLRTEYV